MNQPMVPGASGAAPATAAEVAMVSIRERIPDFWKDIPSSWFAKFEAIMAPQKQGRCSEVRAGAS